MSNIQENLSKILSAVWGKDVRQAIHDSIHDCYEDGKAGTTDLIARERIDTVESVKADKSALSQEKTERLAEIDVERKRINNLSKMAEGSTTGDAELQDIRIGSDGKVYSNAGDAVRGQIGELKGDLVKITSEEYFNILDEEFEQGSLYKNGTNIIEETITTRIRTKNYIPCESNTKYYFNTNGYGVYILWCDENKNCIGQTLGTNNNGVKNEVITSLSGACFFKLRTGDEYGGTYKNDLCVKKSDVYAPYMPHRIANDVISRNAIEEINNRIDTMISAQKPIEFMRFEDVNGIVNGGQAIQDNIITRNGYQFCCYVNGNNKVCIAKRNVNSPKWEHKVIESFPTDVKPDGHYYLSMGMDRDGQIHLVGGEHGSPMRYVRTATPYDIDSFLRMTNMYGEDNETEVSYPCFVNKKDGGLLFFYRSGGSDETYRYIVNAFIDEPNNHTWDRLSSNLIYGNHTDGYPYLNHIVVDNDGIIHISGCWRANENYDIFYMKNDSNGTASSWKKSDGTAYTLPVTRENSEKICDISSIDNGLLNQNGMCVDKNNNPHIVYFKLDENDKTNIFHLYRDNGSWVEKKVTDFEYKVVPNLTSYEGQISRPSIFHYNERLYLIYRHNYDGLNGKLRLRDITDYPNYSEAVLFDGDLGTYEASYDSNSVAYGYLNMLVCHTRTDINEALPLDIRYNEIDWVKKPISGIMSVNLKDIHKVMSNTTRIPKVEHIISGEKIVLKGGKKHYVRLSMSRNTKELAKTSAVVTENGVDTVLGSVYLYASDSDMVKTSNFLLVENSNDVVIKVVNNSNNIDFAYLEVAELIN